MSSTSITNRRDFLRTSAALLALPWCHPARSFLIPGALAAANPNLAQMLAVNLATRQRETNVRDRAAWAELRSLADWKQFIAPRIEALRRSLGEFPASAATLPIHVTRRQSGDGFQIENLVFGSRPGVFVTANLYLPVNSPALPRSSAKVPAIVIIHSHHNSKTQTELQDMGMTWARAGCAVMIPDLPGHGERRDHPAGSRQDYRFRYYSALQLHVLGDSLMGWMAGDISRALDVVLQRANVDGEKVILLGSVAGGGDPAAVVGALDPRFTCVAPFNFGGPQPETRFPLPDDAAVTFNYLGGGSWESTRNLRRSGSDGFLPWAIVASIAPRRLIYSHEFSWDRERDPVWRRLQQVYAWHGAGENLAFAHGHGRLSGRPPDASHCNNIGITHRQRIHAALEKWFGIRAVEYSNPLPAAELACLTPELRAQLQLWPAHEIYSDLAATRLAALRTKLTPLSPVARRNLLRSEWNERLGNVSPAAIRQASLNERQNIAFLPRARAERFVLEIEPGVLVPSLLILPVRPADNRVPLVIGLAQTGRQKFLADRGEVLSGLLGAGIGVCLPDVRGTGETSPEGSREWRSEATSLSATELMLGGTLLGARLRDLRSVLGHLRTRDEVDATRVALWGESFAPVNPPGFVEPLIGEGRAPHHCEPLGGLLALMGALFEDDVRAVVARGVFAGFQSLLRAPFCHVAHDAIVPGAIAAGDLADLVGVLAPRRVRFESLVDGRNVALSPANARAMLIGSDAQPVRSWEIAERSSDVALSQWLVEALRG